MNVTKHNVNNNKGQMTKEIHSSTEILSGIAGVHVKKTVTYIYIQHIHFNDAKKHE